ncbi:GerMN domain-containing protein [Paenibacillus xerothermodurans]|uniref:GerMN domain-containing protein n=1 Tax=Paenibacillus xerothermodurans TaxID=1977292 RepID=A0A2W1NT99_PAEXE|nr:GerMN domain-containing protein [Paenibacillus xerothermodurans]PZE21903.1 hypothetical protein CBW46_005740 [Paenibacillus xerothermodurans]
MHYRLLNAAVLSVAMLALLSACGQVKDPAGDSSTPEPTQMNGSRTPPASAAAQHHRQMNVKVYYGDVDAERLIEHETTISYQEDTDKYAYAIKLLGESDDSERVALFKGFTVKSAQFKDGLLTVDMSMAPEARVGSGGEALLLDALKKTVFQFSEVQSLELLMDGQAVESLMGHVELPHPIQRGT